MSVLDHELQVVKEADGWKIVFVRGSEKRESYFNNIQDVCNCMEAWLTAEDGEGA